MHTLSERTLCRVRLKSLDETLLLLPAPWLALSVGVTGVSILAARRKLCSRERENLLLIVLLLSCIWLQRRFVGLCEAAE